MDALRTKLAGILGHLSTYIERYTVLGIGVLTSLSALLGTVAADLGGAGVPLYRAVFGVTAALSSASAALVWLRGRREWTLFEQFESREDPTPPPP